MHEDPSDGHFADIRDMEDHPEQFMAEDKARAASAGIVLDYHLGKRLPDFLLTHLKPSPTTQNKKKKKASSESSSGGGGVGEDIGAAAAGRAKAHESGTIPASEVAAAAAKRSLELGLRFWRSEGALALRGRAWSSPSCLSSCRSSVVPADDAEA